MLPTLRALAANPWCRRVLLVAWLVLAASTHVAAIIEVDKNFGLLDLHVYRMGGQAVLDGAPLYDLHYKVANLPFTYTPFAALTFVPLAALPYMVAAVLMTALTTAALVRTAIVLVRHMGDRWLAAWAPWERVLVVVAVGTALWATQSTVRYGQINMLVMWLVVEDLLGRPSRWRGAFIGVATGVKLTPGIFIVYLAATRQWRKAFTATGFAAGTVVVGFLAQPAEAWRFWTEVGFDSGRVGNAMYVANQSWNGALSRMYGTTRPSVMAVIGLATIAGVLVVAARLHRDGQELQAVAAVALGGLLASPISWSHHWVWFVVALAALAMAPASAETTGARAGRWILVALVAALACSQLLISVPYGPQNIELTHTVAQRLVSDLYLFLALAMLGALFVRAYAENDDAGAPAGPSRQPSAGRRPAARAASTARSS